MKYFIGCDHAAYEGKEALKKYLDNNNIDYEDLGTHSADRCDYPDFGSAVAERVAAGDGRGILLCGSGIGISMAANRYVGVRAALCSSREDAELSRQHNDSNVLCVGARLRSKELIEDIVDGWMSAKFEGGRHTGRIEKFNSLGVERPVLTEKLDNYEKAGIAFALIFVFIGTLLARLNPNYFSGTFTLEDGFLEYATVVALISGAVVTIRRVICLRDSKKPLFLLALSILACLFVFGAGEEMSWGQRLFGTEVPDYFRQNNTQGETNLHNLIVSGVRINKLFFGTLLGIFIALYFLVLPFLYKKKEKIRNLADSFALPIPKLFHIGAYLGIFLLAQASGHGKKGELLEFGGCVIFFLMTWRPYNALIYRK